jgi:hypothetical protein
LVGLKETQFGAIEVLSKGGTVSAAASAAGVTRKTVHAWMADSIEFADALDEARARLISEACDTMAASSTAWAQTLGSLAVDPTVGPATRIAAARAGLELALRYRDATSLESRLRALEISAGLRKENP